MPLTILNVAYPFAPVGPLAVGGAESVLTQIDAALAQAGHRSIVLACEGSEVKDTFVPVARTEGPLDNRTRRRVHQEVYGKLNDVLDRESIDLVHFHGLDFHAYLPPPGVPVLATLHLPIDWYPRWIFSIDRPDTHLHCVSASQRRTCPPRALLWPEIENGVPLDGISGGRRKRGFVLSLGRVCPEKGFHLALDAAKRAGLPMALAGRVFPYVEHERYFRREIVPRLDRHRRFIGPIGFHRKNRLFGAARALLVPSLAPETSSLVAMEALANGTPVIAFRAGALGEIVEDGRTGFLVGNVAEMADAIHAAGQLDADACREAARARFSSGKMIAHYLAAYEALASRSTQRKEVVHAA